MVGIVEGGGGVNMTLGHAKVLNWDFSTFLIAFINRPILLGLDDYFVFGGF